MERFDVVKYILDKRELTDNRGKKTANKCLNNIIKDNIKKAQLLVGEDNIFKEYFINNKENIRKELAINKEVNTVLEAMALINKIDFRYIFGFDVLIEKIFPCEFVTKDQIISFAFPSLEEADEEVENEVNKFVNIEIEVASYERFGMHVRDIKIKGGATEAWISYSNKKNKYVYTIGDKSKNSSYGSIRFDIFDLYQIFMQCDIKIAIQELAELLKVNIKEIETIRDKYEDCRAFLKANLTQHSFPSLYELIGEHMSKLDVIFEHGVEKIYYHIENKDKWVFSVSMDYLARIMNKSKSTINPVVNTLALLGLLEKPKVNSSTYNKGNRNDITYFYIQEYNGKLLHKAEQLAQEMLYSGKHVTASSFSYAICKDKFGEEIANSIFRDKVVKARAS